MQIHPVELARSLLAAPDVDVYPCRAKPADSGASRPLVFVESRHDDASDARLDDSARARRRRSLVIARLEIDIEGRAASLRSGAIERDDFRVRRARPLVISERDRRLV